MVEEIWYVASCAYHLVENGLFDILVLDQQKRVCSDEQNEQLHSDLFVTFAEDLMNCPGKQLSDVYA